MDALPVALIACSIQVGSIKAPNSATPLAGKVASVSFSVS